MRELVRRVVDLDAVDDLGAVGRGRGRLEAEEVVRLGDVDRLQIEIAVGRREAVSVRAAQVDDDVLATRRLLGEDARHHALLVLRQGAHSFHAATGGGGAS